MKILITGICGFVGGTLARGLKETAGTEIIGLDNLVRSGSELNRSQLRKLGIKVYHGDLRNPSDLESLPVCDWIIDAAANPSVLAGVDGKTSSRQLLEHNLVGTINMLELAKQWRAGLILLSTSRVYSVKPLASLPVEVKDDRFAPKSTAKIPGFSKQGVAEAFSTAPPLSLYGSSKLASEVLALEYAETFHFPVFINRCGVLAGAGQFGKPDQGIFSYWIHSYCQKRPLKYIGFDGKGHQVRDCLHPLDLLPLLAKQMKHTGKDVPRVLNVSGGLGQSASLRQLSDWCAEHFGEHFIKSEPANRPFDVPWLVLDARQAAEVWQWKPQRSMESVWSEIAAHAKQNPHWLDVSVDL